MTLDQELQASHAAQRFAQSYINTLPDDGGNVGSEEARPTPTQVQREAFEQANNEFAAVYLYPVGVIVSVAAIALSYYFPLPWF